MKPLTLYELNGLVRETLSLTLDSEYWVCAEINELHVNRHCYMELAQKDPQAGTIVAKARAQVWANRWAFVRAMFESVTQQTLSPGMQVLAKVQVTFHELYGYSLNITDIDPTYTMGDIARRRQEILQALERQGISTMNQELPLPRLLQRIAVISSATAAGYGDFCDQLQHNKRGLAFKTELFQAVMQGNEVENSIIAALNRIARNVDDWDAVVIIRGGGATSDLQGFDSLALAEHVAQFPLPVITGIGHERDSTIIDLIAHTRVKTPTAVAELLIHHQEDELDSIEAKTVRLTERARQLLAEENLKLNVAATKIPSLLSVVKTREETRIHKLSATLVALTTQRMEQAKGQIDSLHRQLLLYTPTLLSNKLKHIELTEAKLKAADPQHILQLGFSITRVNGKAIRTPQNVQKGDTIETTLAEGTLKSTIL